LLAYAERLIQLCDEARAVVSGGMPQGALKPGALESTTASRLPRILADFHRRYPEVRLELTTGTNDDLMNKVADRRLDAAFTAEPPAARALEHLPVFSERLIVLQRWLGGKRLATLRVLELNSYHAIVACVASGTGIALIPESVLDTMPAAHVLRHAIPKAQANITTPLVWRPVLALRTLIASLSKEKAETCAHAGQAAYGMTGPRGFRKPTRLTVCFRLSWAEARNIMKLGRIDADVRVGSGCVKTPKSNLRTEISSRQSINLKTKALATVAGTRQ
jgi:DNA-binding transcriptional LysR family regulator